MADPCVQEGKISEMSTNIDNINKGIDDIKKGQEKQDKKFEKMFKVLDGNGSVGLVTQTALNKASLVRAWWFIGILGGFLIVAAIKTFIY